MPRAFTETWLNLQYSSVSNVQQVAVPALTTHAENAKRVIFYPITCAISVQSAKEDAPHAQAWEFVRFVKQVTS